MNPESENHNVVCTALSSNSTTIAVASSEFGGGILDVRGSRRREHHHHVVSLYDLRYPNDPITSYFVSVSSRWNFSVGLGLSPVETQIVPEKSKL